MTVAMNSSVWMDMLALTKPRITVMTIIVALGSMMLAPATPSFYHIILSLVGVALLVSSASVFNMYLERDVDPLMVRTKNRPLPKGSITPTTALSLGFALLFLALPALWYGANELTFALGIFSMMMYVLVYTPMKRVSSFALVVGSVPGAMPALMGYTAAANRIDGVAMVVFGILFIWQLPHFIAITIYRGDEYKKAGFPVVAKVVGFAKARWLIILSTLFLVQLSLLLFVLKVGGWLYLAASILLGIWFLKVVLQGVYAANKEIWSRKVFMTSLGYECLLFMALAVDVSVRYWYG